jgi:uncharacterized HAD superfamily protein
VANLLVDIDGTISEDIPNEESYRYAEAAAYDGAADSLRALQSEGNSLTYFTAREEKDRKVTIEWLNKHNFPEARLIMEKPRGGEYVWVDNHKVRGVLYQGSVNENKWGTGFLKYLKNIIKEVVTYG